VVENLLSMLEALSSNSVLPKKKKNLLRFWRFIKGMPNSNEYSRKDS
jgi:hypothetical protein